MKNRPHVAPRSNFVEQADYVHAASGVTPHFPSPDPPTPGPSRKPSMSMFELMMNALRPGWRDRRSARRTPWHALKFPLMLGIGYVLWTDIFFPLIWLVYVAFHPEDTGRQSQFWRDQGVSSGQQIARILLWSPSAILLVLVTFLLTNLVLFCIPWARNAFEREATNHSEMSFRGSMQACSNCFHGRF